MDIKLLNTLYDAKCGLRICDFGHITKIKDQELSIKDQRFGTTMYLAPELVKLISLI